MTAGFLQILTVGENLEIVPAKKSKSRNLEQGRGLRFFPVFKKASMLDGPAF